jgi:class 3 adenylate cyclase/HPt (histidine-containing phosphotransfer) domain-containing protein
VAKDLLLDARKAAEDHAWEEAYDAFRAADSRDGLPPEDLDLMSESAFWAGHAAEAIDARQRAHRAYIDEGRPADAAWSALITSLLLLASGDRSLASGWLGKGQRLLVDLPEAPAHALLAWLEGQLMLRLRGFDQALEKAKEVEAIATRLHDRDLAALGISMQGFLRVITGDVAGGFALIDETMAAALAGELAPFATAEVFCEMVVSSLEVADLERAAEWLDTADRADRRLVHFPGCCRVHRATVLRHRGEWPEAQREARRARAEVAGVEVEHEGMALTEIGELHRCRGEVALAQEAFDEAYEKGWPPQPGLALLRLRMGDVDGANRMIERFVDASGDLPAALVRLLPAQVEIALAAGDDDTVEAAAARLASVASTLGSTTVAAANAFVEGLLLQRGGDLRGAAARLEASVRAWQRAHSPYETAHARVRLADVLVAQGDEGAGRLELAAARRTFERLGAAPEARDAARRMGDETAAHETRTFMFTDIVNSTSLLSAIGDEAWDSVRRWHDRALSDIIAEHRGQIVKATGDGFFVAFEDPPLAVDGAVAIQRALATHRRTDGFSPAVRVGLHAGSAISADGDYAGQDVVIAARISALAGADEILISGGVAEHLGPHVSLKRRGPIELRGIPEPVEVAAVDWR